VPLPVQAPALAASASTPPQYAKRPTWLETVLASRENLLQAEQRKNRRVMSYASDIICGGEAARQISVSIAGQKELYLYVVGAPEVIYGAGTWADARLIDKNGKETLVCELKEVKLLEGQLSQDVNLRSGVSGPLRIAGRKFEHGLHVYPNGISKVHVPLDKDYVKLEAWIGIDDWVGKHGAVRFVVAGPEAAARWDLWAQVALDFSEELPRRQMKWQQFDRILEQDWQPGDYAALAQRYAQASHRIPALAQEAGKLAGSVKDLAGLEKVVEVYHRSRSLDEMLARAKSLKFEALRLAIGDLSQTFRDKYTAGPQYMKRFQEIEQSMPQALARAAGGKLEDIEAVEQLVGGFDQLQREALLANPLLDFDRMVLIKRKPDGDPRMPHGTGYSLGEFIGLPRQTSKHDPGIDRYFGWENELAVLSDIKSDGKLTTLYKPDRPKLINDVDVHWDGDRMLFSMPGSHDQWHLWELSADGRNLKQISPTDQPDVHYYDPCYLPNGKIAFLSTAVLQGVPCNAGVIVGMMYTMNGDGSGIRQICFEQDHDYYPTVLNDGRILYLRWDYTDTPHVWNRMLFTCNPDGTEQMEYYGANSYWPNAIFYTKPIPNHPSKVVGIVTGHHVGRVGELTIFDPSKGRFEADGVVQQIPFRGKKVEPLIEDKLTEHSWPKFLHPQPLSENYFIVSAKPTPDSLWGIYLVDTFDNMVLIKEVEGQALLEPIPLRKTAKPPVIPDRINLAQKDALVYLMDVYQGVSMKGVPRGTVKKLRIFAYHFGYQRIAGIDHRVGADGPWEAKRILGTVNVEEDGSAMFTVPAKTPFTVQPLDADGKAVQLMRSWMTAQPGETLSCVGCHDNRNGSPPAYNTLAQKKPPQQIQPWRGSTRGFSFKREVQPVLDKYCIGCHNDKPRDDGKVVADLRGEQGYFVCYKGGNPKAEIVRNASKEQLAGKYGGIFEPSYIALRSFVRVGGLESDLHLLPPMEFHAETTELIQLLRKGHHNVQLDEEAWDRFYSWIDLNAPCHGTWSEFVKISNSQRDKRRELQRLYGGIDSDPEEVVESVQGPIEPIMPAVVKEEIQAVQVPGWPFDAAEAQKRQAAGGPSMRTVDLGNGLKLELVRIPGGTYAMGDPAGYPDERPQAAVTIDRAYWMGKFEITNEQYALFDPTHDSRFEHRSSWIFSEDYLGWPMNHPKQPVVRISWQQAMAYCRWLTEKTGLKFTLPTEAQWEWACRAGAASALSYGDMDTDFTPFANLGDASIRDWAYEGWRPKSPDIFPRDARFNDHYFVNADVGVFKPNAFGLHDMHGNAAEWTRSIYKPYPYRDDDGRNDPATEAKRVVRGGSWFDRPIRSRSAFRWGYQPYQRVFNVGFRVSCEGPAAAISAR
jgi:formylglycine-generating enzyme required for sulfatase activity